MAVNCKGYEVSFWIMVDTAGCPAGTDMLVSRVDLDKLKAHLPDHLARYENLDPLIQMGEDDIYISEEDFETKEDAADVFCNITSAVLEVLENY